MEKRLQRRLLPVVLLGFSGGAHALTMSVTTQAHAPASAPGTLLTDSAVDSGQANSLSHEQAGYGEYATARGYIGSDGVMGVSSNGYGTSYFSQTELSWTETYTNTSGGLEELFFDFQIWQGGLNVYEVDDAGEWASASFWVDILVDGSAVWSSSVGLTVTDGVGPVVTETGNALGGTFETNPWESLYHWDALTTTLSLGPLDAGESLTIEYIMGSSASGVGVISDPWGCGEFVEERGRCGVGSSATGGDPFGFSTTTPLQSPNLYSTPLVASVPEPGTMVLLGGGALAMGVMARRRRAVAA